MREELRRIKQPRGRREEIESETSEERRGGMRKESWMVAISGGVGNATEKPEF